MQEIKWFKQIKAAECNCTRVIETAQQTGMQGDEKFITPNELLERIKNDKKNK